MSAWRPVVGMSVALALIGAEASAAQTPATTAACPSNPDWSEYRQMRFTVQDQNGQRILLAEGQIDDDMLPRLRGVLEAFEGTEIWIRSPGGNERVAKEAGRLFRDSGVTTRIPSGWACYGACNFMFLGGIVHEVDEGGHYIVQTPPLVTVSDAELAAGGTALVNEIAEQSALMATDDNDYLIRMGVARRILAEIMYQPAADGSRRRCLTRAELERYNISNRAFRPAQVSPSQASKAN